MLFVCSRNVCRSAAAAAVFNYIAQSSASALRARSAGVHTHRAGNAVDPLMRRIAGQRGYDLSAHSACAIDTLDPANFTHAFWIDASHRAPLQDWAKGRVEVRSLMEHSRYPEYAAIEELVMPFAAAPQHGYAVMLDQIEDACLGIWHEIAQGGRREPV